MQKCKYYYEIINMQYNYKLPIILYNIIYTTMYYIYNV